MTLLRNDMLKMEARAKFQVFVTQYYDVEVAYSNEILEMLYKGKRMADDLIVE